MIRVEHWEFGRTTDYSFSTCRTKARGYRCKCGARFVMCRKHGGMAKARKMLADHQKYCASVNKE